MNELMLFLAIAPRKALLQCKPEKQSAAVYHSIAYVDASITEAPQIWRGLIGTTFANYSFHIQESAGATVTSIVRFHNYLFFPRQLSVGEREGLGGAGAGAGRTGGGAGGAPGGPPGGGGGGGYSAPGPSGQGLGSFPLQYPGEPPGGPSEGQPGEQRGEPLTPELSPLLRQELTVVQNNSCDVLGTRGAELGRIRVETAQQSIGMNQILELLFSVHLPNRETTLGERWFAQRNYTVMGIKTLIPVELRFILWPKFNINNLFGLDTEASLALARLSRRPWMMSRYFLVWAAARELPGYGVVDDQRIAVITLSGSTPFEGSEREEQPEQVVERKFKGTFRMGGLLFFDYWNGLPLTLSLSEHVEYTNHETVTPLIEEAKPYTVYRLYNYDLDFDTSRQTLSKERYTGTRPRE
ncbi:MAG: hypothetical protein V2G33_00180 [bacterium JZ-2024 1]